MIYYPPHLKYVLIHQDEDNHDTRSTASSVSLLKEPMKREEWKLSIVLSWTVVAHIVLISFTTFFLLLTANPPPSPSTPLPSQVLNWATFLGVTSALLAAVQYAPQIAHTYRHKVVGALSIPMMCIQTPGAILMVTSIALRPGTNWTSWITFAVAGIMQGTLLVMCICWKFRQQRLGLDDFGNPLYESDTSSIRSRNYGAISPRGGEEIEEVPGLVTSEGDDPAAVSLALAAALESAAGTDLRSRTESDRGSAVGDDLAGDGRRTGGDEATPLLGSSKDGEGEGKPGGAGWFSWFRR
ncbi:hypothetical protein ONZ45_g2687 [Pleurotus djamor]|nr:hypothetical protein ONZ45_g2687 [Pleurotus djamor]